MSRLIEHLEKYDKELTVEQLIEKLQSEKIKQIKTWVQL